MQLFKKLKQEAKEKKTKGDEEKNKKERRDGLIGKWIEDYRREEYAKPVNLKSYYVGGSKTFFYIESYITKEEEFKLTEIINGQDDSKWVHLHHSNRKLQKWGGNVTPNGLENIEEVPVWLDVLAERLDLSGITDKEYRCNHYLLNHYQGASGIMPHTDGPLYHPYVTVVSLGSPVLFKIFENFEKFKEEEEIANVMIEGGSLLVFCDEYYHDFLHCIQDCKIDTIKVDYDIVSGDAGYALELVQSSIDNYTLTSLYKNSMKILEKKVDYESIESIVESVGELSFENYSFQVNVQEKKLTIYVTWERKERISMTIRHVKPAE